MPTTDDCQRWLLGRESRRPAGEPIDVSKYGCEEIDERTAKSFIERHHYSHTYPAARVRVGLFRRQRPMAKSELVGVAVFSQPMNKATIAKYLTASDGAECGRFVLLDDVPANGETWMLGHCFRILRQSHGHLGGIVSYSDPVVRTSDDGILVKPGHYGTIYQAHNARYVGRARAENLVLDRLGRVISRRSLSKIRNDERGKEYAYEQLLAAGAPKRKRFEDGVDYVDRVLRTGPFRRMKHPGNLTYVWALQRGVDIKLPALPYPKKHKDTACGS